MRALSLWLLPLASAVVFELSEDNFDRLVFKPAAPRPAFIKFYAPWCGHCQKIAPDWRKVEKKAGAGSALLVGSVDCSDGPPQEGPGGPGGGGRNPLCDTHKAMSLPTVMYFSAYSKKGFTYEGNKTADEMLAFAAELSSSCSPSTPEECTEDQTKWFAEYGAMKANDVKEKASEIMLKGDVAKMTMQMTQMRMQDKYKKAQSKSKAEQQAVMDELNTEMDKALKEVTDLWERDGELRAMRMVLREKDEALLEKLDEFDMMSMMMGGNKGRGRGGGGGPRFSGGLGGRGGGAKPKKKKKSKKAKDEV